MGGAKRSEIKSENSRGQAMQSSMDHREEPGVDPKRIGNHFSVLNRT